MSLLATVVDSEALGAQIWDWWGEEIFELSLDLEGEGTKGGEEGRF